MKSRTDFQLEIPNQATWVSDSELYPLFKEYLTAVGIKDSSQYDHYQIRIVIKPLYQESNAQQSGTLFDLFRPSGRKQKRKSFASADSLFISLGVGEGIVFRESYPPTITEDGQLEFGFSGNIGISGGILLPNAKANAELQAWLKKQYSPKKLAIVAQRNDKLAIWDFRRQWIAQNKQPELHITCSVDKNLAEKDRFLSCHRRVSQEGRAILAPHKPKKIRLPKP